VIRLGTELQSDTQLLQPARALADYDLLMKCAKVFYLITTPVEFHMRLHSLPPLEQLCKRERKEERADGHKPISRPLLCMKMIEKKR
jgi:hypothetical protein